MNRRRRWGSALAAACALVAILAPTASAVVVHTAGGQFVGILPHAGVAPASVPGSIAAQHRSNLSSNGNLNYHGGPVAHSSTAYLIFWTPNGFSIPGSSKALLQRYFTDAAGDSGTSSNAFAVARQFTDGSGFADYKQTFNPSSQVITDTQGYPPLDQAHCPRHLPGAENGCVTDAQIQAELQRLVTSLGLPNDGAAGSSSLPANAPIYFIVLPSDINVCDAANSCADNIFCAYHSSFNTPSPSKVLLYATVPFLAAAQFPKGCQSDGNARIQEPNGDLADIVLKFLSHEHDEVITDPTGAAWFDNASGNEDGDNCNATGPSNPQQERSPNAFLPTLGGSALTGTLYDQLIGGHQYYLQSEWSNGDTSCQMVPGTGTITASFTQPSGPNSVGTQVAFDPSASTSTNPYASVSWSFGDGATSFNAGGSPAIVHHTYTAAGVYPVTLTLVDDRGNLVKTTQSITIGLPPTASFTFSPTSPLENTSVSFDASRSSDPDSGVHISSYHWDFGDGTNPQTVTTPTTTHTFTHFGTFTVTLTVTNSIGLTDTLSHQVTVSDETPTSSFTIAVPNPTTGQSIPFDGSASSDSDGSIVSYAWSFGDPGGHTATGANPSFAYTQPGTYTVTLIVTDSDGRTSSSSQQVTVIDGPIASFTSAPPHPLVGDTVTFDGSESTDPTGGTITKYSWDFGDGSPIVTGPNPIVTHAYPTFGTFTVKLTVTDSHHVSDMAPQSVQIFEHPPTAGFTVQPAVPTAGQSARFDGSSSQEPDGPLTYGWDFGDGTTGAGQRPAHTYQSYGTYQVTLTVTTQDGQTANVTHQVTVHALPQAAFTYTPHNPGASALITFDGTVSTDPEPGATPLSYGWDFGDGTIIPLSSQAGMPTHSYAAPGDYLVTLTVENSFGLVTTQLRHVIVLTGPTAIFGVQTPHPTSGQPVAFDGSASSDPNTSIATYSWTFGDGGIGTGPTPSHSYSTYGTYTVTLTVTDSNGLSNYNSQQVTVHAPPVGGFSFSPVQPLVGSSVGFDASGSTDSEPGATIASYSWDFGDGSTATGPSPTHTYQRPGTYTVRLTVSSNFGTTSSTAQTVTVADLSPTAVIGVGTTHPVTGQRVRFDGSRSTDGSSPIGSYSWSFGDATGGTGARVAHTYRKPGTYHVALTITDGFGTGATSIVDVRVARAGITGLALRSAPAGATLVVSVNAAGVLSAGRTQVRIRHRGSVRLQIQLSAAQVQQLGRGGSVTIQMTLRFAPRLAPSSRRNLKIVFSLPPAHGRRVYARLQR